MPRQAGWPSTPTLSAGSWSTRTEAKKRRKETGAGIPPSSAPWNGASKVRCAATRGRRPWSSSPSNIHRRHPDRGDPAQDSRSARAASTYTIMTIGDGLVSQIPALIISIAAGFLVSKSGVEGSAEQGDGHPAGHETRWRLGMGLGRRRRHRIHSRACRSCPSASSRWAARRASAWRRSQAPAPHPGARRDSCPMEEAPRGARSPRRLGHRRNQD